MAVLEEKEIIQIIKAGTPDWVKAARKQTKTLNVHINGIGTAEHLAKVNNHENSTQFQLRKDFATSNKFAFTNILRPVDKVFSARGGSKIYKVGKETREQEFKAKLSNVTLGMSLSKWIENIQSNKYYSDPSGIVFVAWDNEDAYPELKSIFQIKNYESSGRTLEWILFEPEERIGVDGEKIDGEFYRFVDDAIDYTIHRQSDDTFIFIEDERYLNPFDQVPAIINSDLFDFTLTIRKSPIDSTVELADHYLRTTSVKNIYEFLHGYPRYWEYTHECPICLGTGIYDNEPCESCHGSGRVLRKDVSDVLALKVPQENDPKIAPDVAGYVQPDLKTWEQLRTELDWLYKLMYFTEWGTTQEHADNDTATGRFIDSQAVNDRLNAYADAFEDMEKKITDLLGVFYFDTIYKGSSINYGRRFLIESATAIWDQYLDAKEKGAPKQTLDYLLIQYYQSEFQNDIETLAIMTKASKVEPFVHKTDEEINGLELVNNNDKIKKYYFNEFWMSLTQTDLLVKTVDQLKSDFDKYILSLTKTEENG
jgi:hypothetical protein